MKRTKRTIIVICMIALMMMFAAVPAMAALPNVVNVTDTAQLQAALSTATTNTHLAYDIHIVGTVSAPGGTMIIPSNVYFYINAGSQFNAQGGNAISNYGVIYINGTINHSSNVTNFDDGKVFIDSSTGEIKGNTKLLTSGDVIDIRGSFKVIFDANGGTVHERENIEDYVLKANPYFTTLPEPVYQCHKFIGWFTEDGEDAWTIDDEVTDDMTLYAQWEVNHDWDDGVVTTFATCEGTGVMTRTCQREGCGETYTIIIPATGHEWTVTEVPPTCTEEGYTKHECGNDPAHDYVDAYVDALGHTEVTETVEATCTEDGYVKVTCEVCGEEISYTVLEKPGHNHVLTGHKDATYYEEGYDEYTCSRCGDTYRVIIPQLTVEGAKVASYNKNLQDKGNQNLTFTITLTLSDGVTTLDFQHAESVNGGQKGTKTFIYDEYTVVVAWNDNNTVTSIAVTLN